MVAPIENPGSLAEVEKAARELARIIDRATPAGWGFALVHFRLGDPTAEGENTASYISNCRREDTVKGLRECAAKLAAHLDDPPQEPPA